MLTQISEIKYRFSKLINFSNLSFFMHFVEEKKVSLNSDNVPQDKLLLYKKSK